MIQTTGAHGTKGSAIVFCGVSKTYMGKFALQQISFEVARGEVFGVVGSNGAGKTTLVALALGLITPSTGQVRVLGNDPARNRKQIASRVGILSPFFELPRDLTARQVLRVYAAYYAVPQRSAAIARLAEELRLNELLDRKIATYSIGERVRLALAKVLIHTPEVILFDEPTAGLDLRTSEWLRNYIKQLSLGRDTTFIITSHIIHDVELLCSRIGIMERAILVTVGTVDEIKRIYGTATLKEALLRVAAA